MPPESKERKSDVWEFFDEVGNTTVCKLCGTKLAYSQSGTKSMRNHLDALHPTQFTKAKNEKMCESNLSKPALKRETLQQTLVKFKPLSRQRYEEITRKLALLCVKDLQSISICTGRGFNEYSAALNPAYKVPTHTTVHNYIKRIYIEAKEQARLVIREAGGVVSITTDLWTSCATHSYITVTCHFITEDWKLKTLNLATRRVDDRHTGENLAVHLNAIKDEYSITRIFGMTTDNASNNIVVARILQLIHIRCFPHTLQLSINEGFGVPDSRSSVGRAIIKSRKIVAFFNRSTVATAALEDHQRKMSPDKKPLHFISDVETRWNSTYYMFERLLLLKAHVLAVIHMQPPISKNLASIALSDKDWQIIEAMVPALEPLVLATKALGGDEYPTSSSAIPLTYVLINTHLATSDTDYPFVNDFREKVIAGLRSCVLAGEFWLSDGMIASALDPRYRKLAFLSQEQRDQVAEKVSSLLAAEAGTEEPARANVKTEPQEVIKPKSALHLLMGNFIDLTKTPDVVPDDEYRSFCEQNLEVDDDPLVFWRDHEKKFPKLAKLAKLYLAIPATSVPSERAFSTAGLTITKQRASLKSSTADAIIFLNKNYSSLCGYKSQVSISECEEEAEASAAAADVPLLPSIPAASIKAELE